MTDQGILVTCVNACKDIRMSTCTHLASEENLIPSPPLSCIYVHALIGGYTRVSHCTCVQHAAHYRYAAALYIFPDCELNFIVLCISSTGWRMGLCPSSTSLPWNTASKCFTGSLAQWRTRALTPAPLQGISLG